MTHNPPATQLPSADELQRWVARALEAAQRAGASGAEASLSVGRGFSVSVRKGAVESVEFQRDRELGVTVFFGHRTGSASTTELGDAALRETVDAACAIARAAGEDPCVGLADAERMATEFPDLDLHHPWALTPDEAIELARGCEAAAFAADPRVTQSEGASADTREGLSVYGNTHGFIGTRRSTEHSIGCAAIAVDGEAMEVGHWYTAARRAADLEAVELVGRKAGRRAAARLGPGELAGGAMPVLFPAEVARGLFGHFIGAISGGALYRRASFLLDKLGEPVFADAVSISQQPFLPRAVGSSPFDQEGVATVERKLVDHGRLAGYLLSSYSARRLGLHTTGNAGGVYNMLVEPTYDGGFDALIRDMGRGLIVTDLMGQGVNLVTGDYSRGAAGFYVENGEIVCPVDEITIAARLQDLYRGIQAIGSDVDTRGLVRCGSVLVDSMMVAA